MRRPEVAVGRSRSWTGIVPLLIALLLPAAAAAAMGEPTEEDQTFDAALAAELEARSPEAADAFRRANEARAGGDLQEASRLYARTAELVPEFHHANRRRCSVEIRLGNKDEALRLCKLALEAEDSAINHATMAMALLFTPEGRERTDEEVNRALHHAGKAVEMEPDDYWTQFVLCQVGAARVSDVILEKCAPRLRSIAPKDAAGYLFGSLLNAFRGELGDARRDLERARELGLDDETYGSLRASYDEATPFFIRWAPTALGIAVAWIAGFGLLLAIGFGLSAATLRSVQRLPADPSAPGGQGGGGLRKAYRAVLWLCCLYYYLSLPLMLITVLAAGGGIIYGMFAVGQVYIKLVIVVALLVLGTLWAVLKSLLARSRDDVDPGPEIDTVKHPRLKEVLREVAGKVGTPEVDHVYLTPGTEVAVFERGGMFRQIRGAARRCLILGAGVLPDLKVSRLKAILAHEYGHLNNKDTAGGGFALAVRRSMVNMAMGLAESGAATWYNPAWWFVNGFHRIFLRISQGASRLQEIMADRWAVACYGPSAFIEGLRSVIESSVRFNIRANDVIKEAIQEAKPLANLYVMSPEKTLDEVYIDGEVRDALAAEPSPYDSHPSPNRRFELVRALSVADPSGDPAAEPSAWSLFEDREGLERQLTEMIKARIVNEQGERVLA